MKKIALALLCMNTPFCVLSSMEIPQEVLKQSPAVIARERAIQFINNQTVKVSISEEEKAQARKGLSLLRAFKTGKIEARIDGTVAFPYFDDNSLSYTQSIKYTHEELSDLHNLMKYLTLDLQMLPTQLELVAIAQLSNLEKPKELVKKKLLQLELSEKLDLELENWNIWMNNCDLDTTSSDYNEIVASRDAYKKAFMTLNYEEINNARAKKLNQADSFTLIPCEQIFLACLEIDNFDKMNDEEKANAIRKQVLQLLSK